VLNRVLSSKWTKATIFLLSLVPLGYLVWRAFHRGLTANPIEYLTHFTGDWAIRFLLITLAITPLRSLSNRPQFTRFRRMLGLFGFFYAFLHFSIWFAFDKYFSVPEMWSDIFNRPYITAGMFGFAVLIPLAVTSTAGWVRRLGFKRWQQLHRIVYLAPGAGVVHYWWLVKSDLRMPALYLGILAILMGYRLWLWTRKKKPAPGRVRPATVVQS
jgi:sulfoxide reductase heme-binding subunit YedZ